MFLSQITASGCDLFVNRRMEITKLVAPFSRIAPVGLFGSSVHDLLGLNTQPMNSAVGGSHLCPVEVANIAQQNALFDPKKYTRQNRRTELAADSICLWHLMTAL